MRVARSLKNLAAIVVLLLATWGLAACGQSGRAEQILESSASKMKKVESVKVNWKVSTTDGHTLSSFTNVGEESVDEIGNVRLKNTALDAEGKVEREEYLIDNKKYWSGESGEWNSREEQYPFGFTHEWLETLSGIIYMLTDAEDPQVVKEDASSYTVRFKDHGGTATVVINNKTGYVEEMKYELKYQLGNGDVVETTDEVEIEGYNQPVSIELPQEAKNSEQQQLPTR